MTPTETDLLSICCACTSTNGIFNVKCFGAKGDDPVDDFHAIIAARNAVNAAGGGVLFFPSGRFVVSDTIELGANTTVLGLGASSVLLAESGGACFNMLRVRNGDDVRVRDLVLDGNRDNTQPPDNPESENVGCGLFAPVGQGQTGLSIRNVIVRNHHGSGIRVVGPSNSDDPYKLDLNELEVIGCRIFHCGGRGVMVTRATRARIADNVVRNCTAVGIQILVSRAAVIDGNVIEETLQRPNTHSGHGIDAANCFDYVIADNVASGNARWGIVASGAAGIFPPDVAMSQRFVVAHNVCRSNKVGGITIDPTLPTEHEHHDQIQDSFATVASNVCVGNEGHGIHTTHAGYLAVRGNICDCNVESGIAVNASRHAVIADNVLTGNHRFGVTFAGPGVKGVGEHLLGGNVYDGNKRGEIHIADDHPAIRQLQDRWPIGESGGMNLPVKTSGGDPTGPIDGVLYLNTDEDRLKVYADGAWRTLQSTAGTTW